MSRRIDIELTSTRDDGTWTWRAAGARAPRGVVPAGLLPAGTKVGDVHRAEVDMHLDGTEVVAILPPKSDRSGPQTLELLGRGEPAELVTTQLAGRRGRREESFGGGRGPEGRGRRDRPARGREPGDRRPASEGREGDRQERPGGERRGPRPEADRRGPRPDTARRGPRAEGERPPRQEPGGDRRGPRSGGEHRARPPRPALVERPRPKRLRPARTHRTAVLAALPPEQQPVAEQVLRGGIPAVRQAVEKQNEQARAEGRPEVRAGQLVAMAEELLPRLRVAEWRDRADAAVADLEDLDLRDLRSVVVAADLGARDDESRAIAAQLREGLARRVEAEQQQWLKELVDTLAEGRVVRALRLSSRPPKAGAPLPGDLASRLADAASAAMTDDTPPDRWTMLIEAVSFSPVHLRVEPASIPSSPDERIVAAVRKAAGRLPQIAARFGVESSAPARRGPGRQGGGERAGGPPPPPPPPPRAAAPPVEAEAAPAAGPPVEAEAAPAAGPPAEAGTEPGGPFSASVGEPATASVGEPTTAMVEEARSEPVADPEPPATRAPAASEEAVGEPTPAMVDEAEAAERALEATDEAEPTEGPAAQEPPAQEPPAREPPAQEPPAPTDAASPQS
ncbi:MAG: hypothetical protein HYX34_13140 [Actinobacteria bacterium]|nr:hypothetical protein [Actinomycetota bacterium]